MEAEVSSKTSVHVYWTTCLHILEGSLLPSTEMFSSATSADYTPLWPCGVAVCAFIDDKDPLKWR